MAKCYHCNAEFPSEESDAHECGKCRVCLIGWVAGYGAVYESDKLKKEPPENMRYFLKYCPDCGTSIDWDSPEDG